MPLLDHRSGIGFGAMVEADSLQPVSKLPACTSLSSRKDQEKTAQVRKQESGHIMHIHNVLFSKGKGNETLRRSASSSFSLILLIFSRADVVIKFSRSTMNT